MAHRSGFLRWLLSPLLGLVLLSGACSDDDAGSETTEADGPVLATVNGVSITEKDFQERVRAGGASSIARAKTAAGKRAILESMIRTELLWQEAKKRGVRHDRQVRDAINPTLVKRFLGEEFEKTVKIDQVDEREVERIYRERWDEFHFPEVFRFGVIKPADRAAAARIMKRLADGRNDKDVFEMIASGPDNTDDHLRAAEGNIGYLPLEKLRAAVPAHLREAFERLKGTEKTPEIVEAPQGVFIVMMTGHRPAVTRELADVREGLRQQAFRELREKRLNEFVKSFKRRHDVEVHPERLDEIPNYTPERPTPPSRASPNRRDGGPAGDGGAAEAPGRPADGGGGTDPSPPAQRASKRP